MHVLMLRSIINELHAPIDQRFSGSFNLFFYFFLEKERLNISSCMTTTIRCLSRSYSQAHMCPTERLWGTWCCRYSHRLCRRTSSRASQVPCSRIANAIRFVSRKYMAVHKPSQPIGCLGPCICLNLRLYRRRLSHRTAATNRLGRVRNLRLSEKAQRMRKATFLRLKDKKAQWDEQAKASIGSDWLLSRLQACLIGCSQIANLQGFNCARVPP
jgi:hypothetical protein